MVLSEVNALLNHWIIINLQQTCSYSQAVVSGREIIKTHFIFISKQNNQECE